MEKTIWVLEKERDDMLDIQRKINAFGSMRSLCILSSNALKNTIEKRLDDDENSLSSPSLILANYQIVSEEESILFMLRSHPKLAGVPLFFLVDEESKELKDEAYLKGAMVVLKKPVGQSGIIRIERAAWQYETTKNYERIFQKQVTELESAKEIKNLNAMLESRNEFLYRIFGKYFSDELLDVILKKPEGAFIGGEKSNVAVLMADLRSFSSIAENMSADELTDVLNCFFGRMLEVISKFGGTVIEFMGDGVLCVFGAPVPSENFCEKALVAGITMQNEMNEVNAYCKEMGYETLEMGIGIHCGVAFAGNVGSEQMMRYNVIGKVVNECSRIEGCSVGGQVLVSEELLQNIPNKVHVLNAFQISAKGVKKPIEICEINGIEGENACYLEEKNALQWQAASKETALELFLIENKLITLKPIRVIPKKYSLQDIIVEINNEIPICNIRLFSDVEIKIAGNESGEPPVPYSLSGTYAKITNIDGRQLTLHITHNAGELLLFLQQ